MAGSEQFPMELFVHQVKGKGWNASVRTLKIRKVSFEQQMGPRFNDND